MGALTLLHFSFAALAAASLFAAAHADERSHGGHGHAGGGFHGGPHGGGRFHGAAGPHNWFQHGAPAHAAGRFAGAHAGVRGGAFTAPRRDRVQRLARGHRSGEMRWAGREGRRPDYRIRARGAPHHWRALARGDRRGYRLGGYFGPRQRVVAARYYRHDYYRWSSWRHHHRHWRRPWRVGYALPYWIAYRRPPYGLYYDLPPPPYGCDYVVVGRDILLISLATGLVVDALIY